MFCPKGVPFSGLRDIKCRLGGGEGVLIIMDYTGMFCPKGVPFSGLRDIKCRLGGGEGGTYYNGLYRDVLPKRCTFFRIEGYKV